MKDSPKKLAAMVEKLHSILNQIYSLDSGWRDAGGWSNDVQGSTLQAGASDVAIAQAESRFKQPFPPSYKEFLRLHGAWEHFWGDFTLVGIGAPDTHMAQEKIDEYTQEQQQFLQGKLGGNFSAEAAANWESQTERNLFLKDQIPIGTNFNGELWVYDARTRRADGEMTLVFWDISYGAQDPTFAKFDEFLNWAIDEAADRLSQLKEE